MTILAYHSLDAEWDDPLAVRPEAFAKQMRIVASMKPLALCEYARRLARRDLPRGAVAVTFDDGYRNNLTHALPICRALGIEPAIFVAVSPIERGEPLGWRDEARDANEPLDWDGVRELAAAGWTIGSHTMSHRDLVLAPAAELASELVDSRARIAEVLGAVCDTLSYPYGRHDETVRRATADAGYIAAFTLPTGREYHDTALAIPRVGVFRDDEARTFRLKLSSAFLAAKLLLRPSRPVEGVDGGAAR